MVITTGLMAIAAKVASLWFKSGSYAEPFDSKKIADIVIQHAVTAAVSGMASGVLPGVGGIIAGGIAVGAIWAMYVRLFVYLQMPMDRTILKGIASAVLANIVAQLAVVLAAELALSFIPVAGIIAAGLVNFGIVYVAGIVFLNALAMMCESGVDPRNLSGDQLKDAFEKAADSVDVKDSFSEAKNVFKEMRKEGKIKK